MSLLLTFAVLAVIGQAINVMIAMQVDPYSETASLAVFFALLVTVFYAAWKLAVWLTGPAGPAPQPKRLEHKHAGHAA
jgi:hypothetical protein